MSATGPLVQVGIVVIGRNEGERLQVCLASALAGCRQVVYVDSGSTDCSVLAARSLGVEVVGLAPPGLTAAKGRQAGLKRLLELFPDMELVQFVDGDCELAAGWLQCAAEYLAERPAVAVVSGRRRERDPGASIYNRLSDQDWARPTGDTDSCGGDAMMRVRVVKAIGGYNPELIAGEDPEICLRVLDAGHRIVRLDTDMTLHDASMHSFSQWWRRTRRTGWAYAAVGYLHGSRRPATRTRVWKTLAWGIVLPIVFAAAGAVFLKREEWWASVACWSALLFLYTVLLVRIAKWRLRCGDGFKFAWTYAAFCVLGKPAEALGVMQFAADRLLGSGPRLIEYK